MPSAESGGASTATLGSAIAQVENGNDSHSRDKLRPGPRGVNPRRSDGEAVRTAGSLDDAVSDETVQRLPDPPGIEPARPCERRRTRRGPGAQDVDQATADLTHRPGEPALPVRPPIDGCPGRAG